MHKSENVVGEAGCVGVMLLDVQIRLVIEQTVEYIGGIPDADVDHLCVVRRELIGEMSVERPTRLSAIFWIDVPGVTCPQTFSLQPFITAILWFRFVVEIVSSPPRLCGSGKREAVSTSA